MTKVLLTRALKSGKVHTVFSIHLQEKLLTGYIVFEHLIKVVYQPTDQILFINILRCY